ncbi:MAG TPA: acyltransferase [Burkholderiales bacterium]|nr:acyltransferase [Burkholderiales bacterium]
MMGTYRLILALLVFLSHFGVYFFSRNEGVFAVISFFLLSGFVMTAQIEKHYSGWRGIRYFYLDRLMRLYPQFLFYLVLSLIVVLLIHPANHWVGGVTFEKFVLNMLVFPLNINWMVGLSDSVLMPQTWSLALEMCFYVLIPIILAGKFRATALFLSLGIFALAVFHILDPVIFGYRLIPGTLFFFLCGSLLDSKEAISERQLKAVWLLLAVLFFLHSLSASSQEPYIPEVLCGFLIGLPIVTVLRNVKSGAFDTMCGNLSYGVFLNHFLFIWLFLYFDIDLVDKLNFLLLVGSCLLSSWISFEYVEKPVIALRKRIRARMANRIADPVLDPGHHKVVG